MKFKGEYLHQVDDCFISEITFASSPKRRCQNFNDTDKTIKSDYSLEIKNQKNLNVLTVETAKQLEINTTIDKKAIRYVYSTNGEGKAAQLRTIWETVKD